MDKLREHTVYEKARECWGFYSQIRKLWEECTELGLACAHILDRDLVVNLPEEIADVENMIEQIKTYYSSEFRQKVDTIRLEKLDRAETRLNKEVEDENKKIS